jgi:predicted amidophosphoribosyltransferase
MRVLRNCPHCGRLLTSPPGVPCPNCEDEEDRAFVLIEDHLASGGAPTLGGVMQGTGVAASVIRRLVDRGRIHLADAGGAAVCLICGQPLHNESTICSRCAKRMQDPGRGAGHPDGLGRGRMYSAGADPPGG